MAAMFRKSGKRNFRKKNLDNEDEDEGNENQSTESNDASIAVKAEKIKNITKIDKTPSSNSLLSFDNDEDSEVFQVRKSKESRRFSKKASKDKTKKTKSLQKEQKGEDDGGIPQDEKGEDLKIAALRAELREMSKIGDDDEEEEDGDKEDEGDDHLKPGFTAGQHQFSIPDAATIHALKKKREMARQLGTEPDFIPLDDSQKYSGRFESSSRLVREDENDASDDEGPISFLTSVVKQDIFYGKEDDSGNEDDEEEDEETKRWENEQIRKGVSGSVQQSEMEQQGYAVKDQQNNYNQSSVFNPSAYPYGGGYSQETTRQFNGGGRQVKSAPQVVTMETVWNRMKSRLESLQEVHRGHSLEQEKFTSHMKVSEESIEKLLLRGREAERQYEFYQEMRGYVRDLIECLNEKATVFEAIEKSMHELLMQRAQRFVDRRQEDVKDQADEFLVMQTGKSKQSVKPVIDEFGRDMTLYAEECKQRRAAEREGRRMRRRRNRELTGTHTTHHEGMSTDEEETETGSRQYQSESERIINQTKSMFDDVLEDFSSIEIVKTKFEKWKNVCGDSYKNAYISLCLPKLFTMFVRIELLPWNPFSDNFQTLEDMSWYASLIGFGFYDNQDIDPKDDDVKIIPGVIEKAVIPKLTGLVQHVWDPLSTKQSEKLIQIIKAMADDFPTVQAENKATQKLFDAIVTRMRKSVSDDVYVPLYPKQLLENKSSGALAFCHRQYWSCYKLFSNLLLWDGLLSPTTIQQLALDGLLNRYIILALQHSSLYYDSLEKCKMITTSVPKSWLIFLSDNTLPSLETFARFLANLATCLQRSCAGCSDAEKKKARSATKKIIQYLLSIKARDKAKTVAREYSLEELTA